MTALGYIGVFLVGLVLGLLGGGGSILSVPVLTYLFGINAALATVYSLFLVGISSLIGTTSYLRRRLVDFKAGSYFLVPSIFGVTVARRALLPALPEEIFRVSDVILTKDKLILLVFSAVTILASYSMLRPAPRTSPVGETSKRSPLFIGFFGFGAGVVMGFVGAGGGFLIIPVLVGLGKLEMKLAIGTSLLIITVSSLSGFATDVLAGVSLDWGLLTPLSLLSIAGVVLGSWLSKRVSSTRLKRSFGVMVLLVALFIMTKELFFN